MKKTKTGRVARTAKTKVRRGHRRASLKTAPAARASGALDPAFRAKWVAALRSGKFKQHRGSFSSPDNNSFCCLGVAALMAGIPPNAVWGCPTEKEYQRLVSDPLRTVPGHALADRNDGVRGHEPHSFAEIADFIEENL